MDTYSFPVLGGASVLSNFVRYLAGGGGVLGKLYHLYKVFYFINRNHLQRF